MTLPSSGTLSFSDIRSELQVVYQSPFSLFSATTGLYAAINKCSPSFPNSSSPYSVSEWYSYCHTCICNVFCVTTGATSCDCTFPSCCYNFGGFNANVLVIEESSLGKILVGGGFSTYSGTTSQGLIRLNMDGTIDKAFTSGFEAFGSYDVRAISEQTDGKLICGGNFSGYSGTAAANIIRINSGGTIDTSFTYGTGFDGIVQRVVILRDGKILVGGNFLTYNGTTTYYLVRLNSDGTVNKSFTAGQGFNGTVRGLEVQSDDKILVVGDFTTYSGITVNGIVRINTDWTIDSTFDTNTGTGFSGFGGKPQGLIIDADRKIFVYGGTSYQGNFTTNQYLLKLNEDGTTDTSFACTGFTFSTGVFTNNGLELISTGQGANPSQLICAGEFSGYNGSSVTNIVKINPNGSINGSFSTSPGSNNTNYAIKAFSTGEIAIGGNFTSYDGISVDRFAILDANGDIKQSCGTTPTPTPSPNNVSPTPTTTPTPTPTCPINPIDIYVRNSKGCDLGASCGFGDCEATLAIELFYSTDSGTTWNSTGISTLYLTENCDYLGTFDMNSCIAEYCFKWQFDGKDVIFDYSDVDCPDCGESDQCKCEHSQVCVVPEIYVDDLYFCICTQCSDPCCQPCTL